jgi:hypothetical protein
LRQIIANETNQKEDSDEYVALSEYEVAESDLEKMNQMFGSQPWSSKPHMESPSKKNLILPF